MGYSCPTCGAPSPGNFGLTIDIPERTASRNGAVAKFQPMQLRVLEKLAMRPGRVVPRVEIFDHLYGLRPECDQPESDIKIIDNFMCRARPGVRSLGLKIVGVWGTGYRLEEAPQSASVAL